jgi:hypothetical protein
LTSTVIASSGGPIAAASCRFVILSGQGPQTSSVQACGVAIVTTDPRGAVWAKGPSPQSRGTCGPRFEPSSIWVSLFRIFLSFHSSEASTRSFPAPSLGTKCFFFKIFVFFLSLSFLTPQNLGPHPQSPLVFSNAVLMPAPEKPVAPRKNSPTARAGAPPSRSGRPGEAECVGNRRK